MRTYRSPILSPALDRVPPSATRHAARVAWLCLSLVACVDEVVVEDKYAGVTGAVALADGGVAHGAAPKSPATSTGSTVSGTPKGSTTTSSAEAASTIAPAPGTTSSTAPAVASTGAPALGCDLTGRWLITDRSVVSGLGIRQASLTWWYYEIAQNGDAFEVKRGFFCGGKVTPIDPLGEEGDFSQTWNQFVKDVRPTGRKGTSKASAKGCSVSFERYWELYGLSPYYAQNPTAELPTTAQKATDTTPGWLDSDRDGKPGFATKMSGLVSGTVHVVQRKGSEWAGDIAANASKFQLHSPWTSKSVPLAIDGSDLLASESTRDPEEAGHYGAFAKLADGQAASTDDLTVCAEVRKLALTLTPDANR
jgi:hypothetical protein